MSKRRHRKLAPFIGMDRHQHKSAAFAALSAAAQALLVLYHTKMMNAVYLSARLGARKINTSKNTAARGLAELEHYGFIVKVQGAHLGVNGIGKSAHYRLTAQPYGNLGATRDYQNWNGDFFRPKNRIPSHQRDSVSHQRYIRAGLKNPEKWNKCPTRGT